LVDREATSRENKRLARRLREARLRQSAVVEDVDFRAHRGLDRALFLNLATCQWIRDHHHLALVGPTGIGKSWLACALGHKACREGFSVLYKRASRLFTDLAQARGEGRLPRLMNALERTRLLIIDDWGPEPLNAEQRRDLLEIVDDRYDRGSLLITSQLPVPRSPTPFSTASSTAPIVSISKAHRCAGAWSLAKAPLHERPCGADRPRGPTAPPHARRSVAREGTARRARVPSVDSVDDPLPP
ncbi:MAG TPA: ATP-binding protein, partial [Solirubrobacterales bacterium]|nr:ATP-binding protein [Solirubrobacterales bacterium]